MILRPLLLAALVALGVPASAAPAPQRIVSLIPSLTEDLFAVGAGTAVVGVSEYTDYPPQARRLPVVASFASVNAERIVALHPDLVLGVVAQQRLVADLTRTGIPLRLLADDTLADVYANLRTVGDVTGHGAAARALIARLQARTAYLRHAARHGSRTPSVFVVLGTAPIFTVGRGSYIANLIDLAGGRNAASTVDSPYARYSAEALVAHQPDILVVDPDIHFADVVGKAPWNTLSAVRNGRVYTLPDAAILERPGPRYNDGLAWLVDALAKAAS